VVTNHVPLNKSGKYKTIGLIGENHIGYMKSGALIVHASRGGVIDEKPLYDALHNNKISAMIDVWKGEPLINTALARRAIQISPHIGGYSRDGKLRGTRRMAEAFENFSGAEPDYSHIDRELDTYKPAATEEFTEYETLIQKIDKSRDFSGDHRRFFETLSLPDELRAEAFDSLRKNYPIRREVL
jgi:erythronate-4-phosphate dehydrogenase